MENMENLKVLQSMAKDFTILFVEDSKALQKQVVLFLGKFFKEVYVASDGVEGVELYKEHKPDLILTDLTMPRMNGHDMIREIKKLDADVEIIILSAHSDPDTLMTSFHIGVSDFIQKPITAPKMITVCLKVLLNIKRKKEQIEELVKNNIDLENDDILNFIYEGNLEFDLINYYRGVPIINSGKILKLDENEVIIKTTFNQLMAIKYENVTTIDCPEVSENVFCKVKFIDLDSYSVKLEKQKVFFPNSKHNNLAMVEPDEFFRATLVQHNYETKIRVSKISTKEIIFKINDNAVSLSKHENLKIVLDIDNEIIQFDSTIFKIDEKNDYFIVTAFIKHSEDIEKKLEKYIYKRETELIEEFKNSYLHN